MGDKLSVLVKYKYLEYIKAAKLSKADSWDLMEAIIEYDQSGNEPVFENPVLTGIFTVIKIDLNENKEKWEKVVEERKAAGKAGAEKKRQNKQMQAKQANAGFVEKNKQDLAKQADYDLDLEFDREREGSLSENFSVDDESNRLRKDLVSRIEGRRKKWESCKMPPAPIITNLNVLNDLKDCFETYADEKIDEAIKNFAGVISQPGFDESTLPGGHKPNFKNFLLRWVDRFIDEADPFKTFRKKTSGPSPPEADDWSNFGEQG